MNDIVNQETLSFQTDANAVRSLSEWRSAILEQAASILTDPGMPDLQRQIGVWKHGDTIPYPSRDNMTVLGNGCLVFDVPVAEFKIRFSVWLIMGEVRVGARVPHGLTPNKDLFDHISEAYDGLQCPRQTAMAEGTMFDWIFRDGFASFDAMEKSLRDPLMGAVIATRIGEILLHLYLAILSSILDDNRYEIRDRKIGVPPARSLAVVRMRGDISAFKIFASDRSAIIKSTSVGADNIIAIDVELEPAGGKIPCGFFHDSEAGDFEILSVDHR